MRKSNAPYQIVLTFVFLLAVSLGISAQTNQKRTYLQKTGLVDSLYSQILNESREIYVQLPADFNPGTNHKYPVTYILDGEVLLPSLGIVHDFYSGGFMPEMVLVGISNRKNRTRDLTGSHIETKYGMPFNEENGKAENFSKFIELELIPFIENKYSVSDFRTLIGHSYGGLFTIYTLLNHTQLFSNYLAIDPSLDWDNQKIIKDGQRLLATQNYENKALYMSLSGQLHMQDSGVTIDNVMQDNTDFTLFARSNIAFSNVVRQNTDKGLRFDWRFYPRDLHGTVSLPSILDGLLSLFEWFQMENTDKINAFDTPIEELLSIIRYREKKLLNHFGYPVPPYPEELLNMSGYMNLDMQQAEKAKMYFELTIEYYPKSANAYDSMADFYESQNDIDNALLFVTKAYQINDNNYYKQRIEELKKRK